ncbi:IS630 family transposase [Acuticoccus sp.]|uniref:IS630 family transposase n=1 Tax=Acuticoccus sp. TaxID=1904378 RepID=UPI003B525208
MPKVWRASSTGRDPVAGLPSPTANWRCLPSGSSRARSKDRWRRPGRCRTSPRSLEERFGKTITPQSLSRLLRREGFLHQKARPVHPKASAKARAGFEKRLRNALNEVAAAHPDKRIVLWFQDEMRVGQKGRLCHRWWLKGERAPGRQDRRFSFTDLFDAARADGEAAFALVLPEVGTAAMQLFLDRFADTLLPDEHAVMVFDGAGWHGASALVIPPNVTLVPLPPYSLQLNPMARVWLSLRARHPSLRLLRDTEAIVDACCEAWNALVGEAGRLRSLCLQPWIRHVIQ